MMKGHIKINQGKQMARLVHDLESSGGRDHADFKAICDADEAFYGPKRSLIRQSFQYEVEKLRKRNLSSYITFCQSLQVVINDNTARDAAAGTKATRRMKQQQHHHQHQHNTNNNKRSSESLSSFGVFEYHHPTPAKKKAKYAPAAVATATAATAVAAAADSSDDNDNARSSCSKLLESLELQFDSRAELEAEIQTLETQLEPAWTVALPRVDKTAIQQFDRLALLRQLRDTSPKFQTLKMLKEEMRKLQKQFQETTTATKTTKEETTTMTRTREQLLERVRLSEKYSELEKRYKQACRAQEQQDKKPKATSAAGGGGGGGEEENEETSCKGNGSTMTPKDKDGPAAVAVAREEEAEMPKEDCPAPASADNTTNDADADSILI